MDTTAILLAIPAAGFIFFLGTVVGYGRGVRRGGSDVLLRIATAEEAETVNRVIERATARVKDPRR